jgi:hypothetical protein
VSILWLNISKVLTGNDEHYLVLSPPITPSLIKPYDAIPP